MPGSPNRKVLPEPTVARLPIYQRIAIEWGRRGHERIDSTLLGRLAGVAAATVRRDLSSIGPIGTRGSGYEVAALIERITWALGDDEWSVVLVGMGNLGHALVNSNSFLIAGAKLVGIYDASPEVIGTSAGDLVVSDVASGIANADLGIICVPPAAAQEVTNALVDAGIHAILNFAPQVVTVPIGVAVRYVDVSIELQILAYQLANGTGPLGGGVLHALGISRPARRADA